MEGISEHRDYHRDVAARLMSLAATRTPRADRARAIIHGRNVSKLW
jgi:hypothetical protein